MSRRQRYAPHAVHLSPAELSRKLAAHWCAQNRMVEWWEPSAIPTLLREVCDECFKFAHEQLDKHERDACHVAILDAQPSDARPFIEEREVVEAACLALLAVGEAGGFCVSLCNGANGVLHG